MEELKCPVTQRTVSNKKEFRAYIPRDMDKLVRAIAGLKNGSKDWTLSDVMEEAFTCWLEQPEQQRLIKDHNLNNLK